MAQMSSIEWTNSTWNPVVGCSLVSSGCKNCYAQRMARRLSAVARGAAARGANPGRAANYLRVLNSRGRWNGRIFLDEAALDDPLHWRSGRMVFVNSMSDLFHERVPLDFIQRLFAVVNRCSQHTFQILTKRPQIAASHSGHLPWPTNAWLGTSVENATVTHRIGQLRETGARVKFLSLEPLLGPIPRLSLKGIDWVIVGGESGPGARPMKAQWVRRIRDRCLAQSVPFFFKQWGGVNRKGNGRVLDGHLWDQMPAASAGGLPDAAIARA